MVLNINTDATVIFTNRLERMGKSQLPIVIRNTLNNAAFDVKKNTMPAVAQKAFVSRSANFFKANSKVDMAKGSDISSMKATVGMWESNALKGKNNYAVEDMEEQEHGGSIDRKSFIPTNAARKGGYRTLVRPNARLSAIKNIVNAKNVPGINERQKFVHAASMVGAGGFVLYKNTLFRIDARVVSSLKTRKANIKRTPLYSFRQSRKVRVKASHFFERASIISARKIDKFYIEQAEKILNK